MLIAVCCSDERELRLVCSVIAEQAAEVRQNVRTAGFRTEEELWREFAPGRFAAAVVGYGDIKGFLCARRLREEDVDCRVILLDDTERYAIRGFRIHLSDFLLRPLTEQQLRAAVRRILI